MDPLLFDIPYTLFHEHMSRSQAEQHLRVMGMLPGDYVLRRARPETGAHYVISCVHAIGFVHHLVVHNQQGFSIKDNAGPCFPSMMAMLKHFSTTPIQQGDTPLKPYISEGVTTGRSFQQIPTKRNPAYHQVELKQQPQQQQSQPLQPQHQHLHHHSHPPQQQKQPQPQQQSCQPHHPPRGRSAHAQHGGHQHVSAANTSSSSMSPPHDLIYDDLPAYDVREPQNSQNSAYETIETHASVADVIGISSTPAKVYTEIDQVSALQAYEDSRHLRHPTYVNTVDPKNAQSQSKAQAEVYADIREAVHVLPSTYVGHVAIERAATETDSDSDSDPYHGKPLCERPHDGDDDDDPYDRMRGDPQMKQLGYGVGNLLV